MQLGSIFFALNAESGKAPGRLQILPSGPIIQGRDGRTWVLSDPAAVLAATAAREVDLSIDINHATDLKAPLGNDAPAVGWLKDIAVNDSGEIWANVEWTDEGKSLIESRKYRYISPVFHYDENREISDLLGASLCNRPNLRLPALNSESIPDGPAAGIKEDTSMKKIYAALGLAETASEDEAVTAINSLKEKKATNAQAGVVDLSLYAPRADLAQMETRALNAEKTLTDLKAEDLKKRAGGAVEAAIKARKIAPASKDAYLAMCATEEGLKQFETIAKATASIIPAAPEVPAGTPPAGETALNAEEMDQAKKMGYTPEEWKKVKEASK